MKKRFAVVFAFALVASQGASALSFDQTTNTNKSDGSAKFSDPDDNVPFAHFDDSGNVDASRGFNTSQERDAFTRAQENQKQ